MSTHAYLVGHLATVVARRLANHNAKHDLASLTRLVKQELEGFLARHQVTLDAIPTIASGPPATAAEQPQHGTKEYHGGARHEDPRDGGNRPGAWPTVKESTCPS